MNKILGEIKIFLTTKLGIVATAISIIGGCIAIFSFVKTLIYPQLSGTWVITFKVQESSYKPYINDEYVYEIYVTQEKNIIAGDGEQTRYNGNIAKHHFKMEWSKTEFKDKINLNYKLYGTRPTSGLMELKIDPKDKKHLTGIFHGAAADTKGNVDIKINE